MLASLRVAARGRRFAASLDTPSGRSCWAACPERALTTEVRHAAQNLWRHIGDDSRRRAACGDDCEARSRSWEAVEEGSGQCAVERVGGCLFTGRDREVEVLFSNG